jgi:hypothetical protein
MRALTYHASSATVACAAVPAALSLSEPAVLFKLANDVFHVVLLLLPPLLLLLLCFRA